MGVFVSRLRELGNVPGQTLEIVSRFSDGVPARLPELARQLIEARVEVVFAPSGPAAGALQQLSHQVAIVFVAGDPVRAGLVASLARPGRNATGFTRGAESIAAKRMEILLDAFPSIKRVGVLSDSRSDDERELSIIEGAARQLKVELILQQAGSLDQYVAAVARLHAAGVNGYYVIFTGSSFAIRRELAAAISRTRLPAIYGLGRFADDGGLMAYSWRTPNVAVKAAEIVDRILHGARPSEIPVQEPTIIELVVNLATAREQALAIRPSILQRADRLIE
ncbi:MAG: ABC transporter substrate-binding protein [Burkholderiaceae bacterium]